jgi:hypothetical protein
MIPRKNKIYHFDELIDDTQCRRCKHLLEWCSCEPSQGVSFEAICCKDAHHIQFRYNDKFELKGRYERKKLQHQAVSNKQVQSDLPKVRTSMAGNEKQEHKAYWTVSSDW